MNNFSEISRKIQRKLGRLNRRFNSQKKANGTVYLNYTINYDSFENYSLIKSDSAAISSDFNKIGKDLYKVLDSYERKDAQRTHK